MARTYWTLYSKASGSWVADGSLARPNDSLELPVTSTQVEAKLADGSEAFFTPTTKYLSGSLVFKWLEDDGTIKDKIEGYVQNGTPVKIVDHNAVSYIGKFVSCSPNWLVGVDGDYYDIQATFKQMPSLA